MAPVTFLPPPAPASSTRLLLPPAAILGLAVLAYIICLGLVFALRNCLLSRGCAACDGDGLCSGSSWCWDRCAACAHACDIMVPTPLTCHDRCCRVVPWLPPGCDCTCAWQPPQFDACNCICFEIRLR